ncbi:hypothetical protein H1Z61_15150 [Bacillus aquiflavi]|uniref:Uncharacterized protein n=1 Tax=Bacillus aquiflavi TaxID=2672567 RepID=A0A6B3W4D7_9BACI|nr:Myb-like DNA-binding domain-containing protein [Bacillus aquiflavi]MBA4538432.1 hypothetical protein [Bacillus aquiflavi]NEY82796.1 hypothetical protein [Bacillus aquiflavi]UAC47368.1 hypothetical protein K6959_11695 [Bacillus aquiflavi]
MVRKKKVWTQKEDKILIEIVTCYKNSGKTQTEAFKDAGQKLQRTAAACRYRWNNKLRKNENEKGHPISGREDCNKLNLETIIEHLQTLKIEQLENNRLKSENEMIKSDHLKLKNELKEREKQFAELRRKYRGLMNVISEAKDSIEN